MDDLLEKEIKEILTTSYREAHEEYEIDDYVEERIQTNKKIVSKIKSLVVKKQMEVLEKMKPAIHDIGVPPTNQIPYWFLADHTYKELVQQLQGEK